MLYWSLLSDRFSASRPFDDSLWSPHISWHVEGANPRLATTQGAIVYKCTLALLPENKKKTPCNYQPTPAQSPCWKQKRVFICFHVFSISPFFRSLYLRLFQRTVWNSSNLRGLEIHCCCQNGSRCQGGLCDLADKTVGLLGACETWISFHHSLFWPFDVSVFDIQCIRLPVEIDDNYDYRYVDHSNDM